MSKQARKKTVAVVDVLNELVPATANMEAEIERLSKIAASNRTAIKAAMDDAGLLRFATKDGHEALIFPSDQYKWKVPDLVEALGKLVDEYCPRTPDTKKLRDRMNSDKDFLTKVARCFKTVTVRKIAVRKPVAKDAKDAKTTKERKAA